MRLVHTLGLALALGLLGLAPPARAEGLSAAEQARLARGATVIREQDFQRGDRRYVGGVTYTVLDAGSAEVEAVLEDVDAYRKVLPRTKRARLVDAEGRDRFVELVQGNALVEAEYTIRVRKDAPTGLVRATQEYRFWLDPSRPHGIDDAWGYFRLEPFVAPSGAPRVLLTFAVLVDVGPGIVRELFEERLRATLLTVPQLVRRHVADARAER